MGCLGADALVWNDPYPKEPKTGNTLYSAFAERPKHLDPARSYSSGEWTFVTQIYEPPLQYHYLKRPYTLEPLLAASMPKIQYQRDDNKEIVYSDYIIKIKPKVLFQPHPCFAKNSQQNYLYHKHLWLPFRFHQIRQTFPFQV